MGDPVLKNSKDRLTSAQLLAKYKSNPYIQGGRNEWGSMLDKTFPNSNIKVRDAINNAASTTGVDPALLYTSAMEEGLAPIIAANRPREYNKNKQFPIDGFSDYGLDTFGDSVDSLTKKGYLPKDFNTKYQPATNYNEKDQEVNTAVFATDQDALTAKAAMIRDIQDQLNTYTTNKKLNLSDEGKQFFTLAGYNGGIGNMQKMLDSYNTKGYLKDDNYLSASFKPSSYAGIYSNVQKRLQNSEILKNEGYFKMGGNMKSKSKKYAFGTEDPLNPFKPLNSSNTPTDPNRVNIPAYNTQPGSSVKQDGIVPITDFYDIINSEFGNKKLQSNNKYINDQGEVSTVSDAQNVGNQISSQNEANANKLYSDIDSVEMPAAIGITAINSLLAKKDSNKRDMTNYRRAIEQTQFAPIVNPYAEGNGSQAIFKKGGVILPGYEINKEYEIDEDEINNLVKQGYKIKRL